MGSLVKGSLSEIWNLIKGKIGKNKMDIMAWIFIERTKVCKNIIEAGNLTSLLAQNGIFSLDGELNNEGILEGKKFKLNSGIKILLLEILIRQFWIILKKKLKK